MPRKLWKRDIPPPRIPFPTGKKPSPEGMLRELRGMEPKDLEKGLSRLSGPIPRRKEPFSMKDASQAPGNEPEDLATRHSPFPGLYSQGEWESYEGE